MNVYTDPKLPDVSGAMDVLPDLPLDGLMKSSKTAKATGTLDELAASLAPMLAPTSGTSGASVTHGGTTLAEAVSGVLASIGIVSSASDTSWHEKTLADTRVSKRGGRESNPQPPDRQANSGGFGIAV